MVGHILNDFMLPTTFFSLQVELPVVILYLRPIHRKWLGGVPLVGVAKHDRNGGPELAASACTCSSVDRF